MWESRVLCEISKSLWKPFCGFHRDVISTAVFVVFVVADAIETGIRGRRYPYPVSDRGSWRLLRRRRSRTVRSDRAPAGHWRRLVTKGPGARRRPGGDGTGAGGVGRERPVR